MSDEWSATVEFSKVDEELRLVGGWASVALNKDGYPVNDTQGDVIDTPEAIAAWEKAFVQYGLEGRDGDVQHEFFKAARLVELAIFTPDKTAMLAKALGLSGDSKAVAAYVSFYLPKTDIGNRAWDGVKSGKLRMFSIVGDGRREPLGDAA